MTQYNFENDNKYHERSMQARKSTLISVVVNIFLSVFQVWWEYSLAPRG